MSIISLKWLPDETVFSLCSRFHVISGHSAAHQTTRAIFQHHRTGSSHDLPSRLDYFASRFDGKLGAAHEISVRHTILPFYLSFRAIGVRHKAVTALCGAEPVNLKYRLGLLTSNQGALHPLKACVECIKSDTEEFGCDYWHLAHQFPGSALCLKHQLPLLIAKDKTHNFHRFLWILPRSADYTEYPSPHTLSIDSYTEFQRFLEAYAATAIAGEHFDKAVIIRCVVAQLVEQGYSKGGHLRALDLQTCSNGFLVWLAPLQQSPYIINIPNTEREALLCLQRTVRATHAQTHPLNTLLVLCWVFRTWGVFQHQYETCSEPGHLAIEPPITNINTEKDRTHRVALQFLTTGRSARATAAAVGVDTQTVICWANAAGITISKRPRSSKIKGIERAKKMLLNGIDKLSIEKECNISRPTINRILQSSRDLQQSWVNTRYEKLSTYHRNRWELISNENPTFSTKDIRLIAPEVYAWLYRNDRDWLLLKNKFTNFGQAGNYSSVQWDKRDHDYADQIKKVVYDFWIENPDRKLERHELLRQVPDLAKKIRYLSRLPLTRKALKIALLGPQVSD